jgi:hypothetical protein
MDDSDDDAPARPPPVLVDIDEDPPVLIDLLAENYRFKLAERRCQLPKPPAPDPKPVVSILVVDCDHRPQTLRSVHFTPAPFEFVPRHAEIFDIHAATSDYNERVYERQQFVLQQAAKRCDHAPSRGAPKALSSQRSPRPSERQPQKNSAPGITLPSKHTPRVTKRPPRQDGHGRLGDTLTISRVIVPDYRRPKSTQPVARDASPVQRQPKSTTRRYRSPPPKAQRSARPSAVDTLRLADGTELLRNCEVMRERRSDLAL